MRNDWSKWFSAKVLAMLGFELVWNYGTSKDMERYIRSNPWLMMFGIRFVPWMEPPVDYADWDKHPDRWTYRGVAAIELPGIKGLNLGPAYFLGTDRITFWRTPDSPGGFTGAVDPETSTWLDPEKWIAQHEAKHNVENTASV